MSSSGGHTVPSTMSNVFFTFLFFFCSFLAFLLEGHNPGHSHYKSCLLDVRPQTGDRLCNLVSLSIPLGFMGRCLTLQAGYLLATLKATFLLTSHLGSHTYNVCMHADMQEKKKRKKNQNKCVLCSGKALQATSALLFLQKSYLLYFLRHRFSSSNNP